MKITLKAARVNVNLKQSEAAKIFGVDKKTLSSWEQGKTFPSADKVPVICETYKRRYDEIQWSR